MKTKTPIPACSYGNVCEVTSATRERCPACRYNRCIQLGMEKWSIAKSTPLRLKREELYDKIGLLFHAQNREVPFDECYQQVQIIATEIGYSVSKLKEKYVRDFIYRHLAREYRMKKGEVRPRATPQPSKPKEPVPQQVVPAPQVIPQPHAVPVTQVVTTQAATPIHHQTELQPTIYQNTVPVHFMPSIFRNSIEFA